MKCVNLIYHVEERKLTRYVGDYYEFKRIYEENKKRLEQAYEKQQKEIARLEDFVARNKANVATSNMAKSRQKKLDKMERIELLQRINQNLNLTLRHQELQERLSLKLRI